MFMTNSVQNQLCKFFVFVPINRLWPLEAQKAPCREHRITKEEQTALILLSGGHILVNEIGVAVQLACEHHGHLRGTTQACWRSEMCMADGQNAGQSHFHVEQEWVWSVYTAPPRVLWTGEHILTATKKGKWFSMVTSYLFITQFHKVVWSLELHCNHIWRKNPTA